MAEFSITEIPHYHRLVTFLEAAEAHGDAIHDEELQTLVRVCRIDLLILALTGEGAKL